MEKRIEIQPKIIAKDLALLSVYVLYRKVRVFLFIFIVFLILSYSLPLDSFLGVSFPKPSLTIILFLIIFPIVIYFGVLKSTKKNPKIKEDITYIITENFLEQKGESFYVKHAFKDLNKSVETKRWFLIYINKLSIIFINKKDVHNKLPLLRSLLSNINQKTRS